MEETGGVRGSELLVMGSLGPFSAGASAQLPNGVHNIEIDSRTNLHTSKVDTWSAPSRVLVSLSLSLSTLDSGRLWF